MNLQQVTFVVYGKKFINQTVGSINYDSWGRPLNCDIRFVDHWVDVKALKNLKKYLFLIKSGTVFTDIESFFKEITPAFQRSGLGHIFYDNKTDEIYLNDQALLIESAMLPETFGDCVSLNLCNSQRSEQNIHHDYTPIYIKALNGSKHIKESKFGQDILNKYLKERGYFNNFSKYMRKYKTYLYENNDNVFKEYIEITENTLWIFNSEPIKINKNNKVLCTGGGINWLFQTANTIHICDISRIQIKFIEDLINEWDGNNFGDYVFKFILKNKVTHFHTNFNQSHNINKDLIKNKEMFIKKINENFDYLVKNYSTIDFQHTWTNIKKKKLIIENKNILEAVKNYRTEESNISNILDFKYNYVTDKIDNWKNLISPVTKMFIKNCVIPKQNPYKDPPCKQVNLNVPIDIIDLEIQKIEKFLVSHREGDGMGWKSFCIHGKSYDATREDEFYKDNRPHIWTQEALENMPNTINFLKSLGFKNFKRVRVMCLEPKGFINIHRDREDSQLGPINIAITHPKGCKFYLENHGELVFNPGTAYQLNLVNYHAVLNDSFSKRYHIIVHGDK